MDARLYYFTGTGNSLWVARELAAALESGPPEPMVQLVYQPGLTDERPVIGFVFPLYYFGLPAIVRRFIATIALSGPDRPPYCFAVITRASLGTGGAIKQLRKLLPLKRPQQTLDAAYYVNMPNNYFVRSDVDSAAKQQRRFDAAGEKIQTIVTTVRAGERGFDREPLGWLTPLIYRRWYGKVHHQDEHLSADERCNSCGICARICPVDNITLDGGRPVWQHRCQECWGCINYCPQHAIQYDRKTVGKGRYHHPAIGVKMMMQQKGKRVGEETSERR